MRKYRYRVYDAQEKCLLPGDYDSAELRVAIGIRDNFSKYAKAGVLLRHRYRIMIADDDTPRGGKCKIPPEKLEEWDRVRLEILGVKR